MLNGSRLRRVSVVPFALVLLVTCRTKPNYVEGGLYSVEAEKGGYAVIKILKVDAGGVHLQMYSNLFTSRPQDVDVSKLFLAGKDYKPGEQLGMGHVPMSHASFHAWNAKFIKTQPVREDELDGYRMWKEAKGGYF